MDTVIKTQDPSIVDSKQALATPIRGLVAAVI
jgi:hypothetical protein